MGVLERRTDKPAEVPSSVCNKRVRTNGDGTRLDNQELPPVRSFRRPLLAALVAMVGLIAVLGFSASPLDAAPTWAPEATAAVHPGVQTDTAGGQCTANFIFTAGTEVYIGQAAHCAG